MKNLQSIFRRQFTLMVALFCALQAYSQNRSDSLMTSTLIDLGRVDEGDAGFSGFESFKEILKDAEIVMLGEQSHGEATTYETKIKLIKYLHQEMGFDLLLFESGLYDCSVAWEKIKNGEDVRTSMANSIFYLWSTTEEFKPLANYVEAHLISQNPLIVSGFDGQFTGRISENEFVGDLKAFLETADKSILESEDWRKLEISLQSLVNYELKKYEKTQAMQDTTFINTIIEKVQAQDSVSLFWVQVLKSAKYLISDLKLKTNYRDRQMAENLIWIKEQNPGKKIICWGATSHFLYNSEQIRLMGFPYNLVGRYYRKQPMMGEYIKQKYGPRVFTIGFIAYEGEAGLLPKHKIKPAKENSLEYAIAQSGLENCFLSFENYDSKELISRPLGNKYMKNNISNVMDGVVFNRTMERPQLDKIFFHQIYPENKWIQGEIAKESEQ